MRNVRRVVHIDKIAYEYVVGKTYVNVWIDGKRIVVSKGALEYAGIGRHMRNGRECFENCGCTDGPGGWSIRPQDIVKFIKQRSATV